MALAWRRDPKPSLITQPWRYLDVTCGSDGAKETNFLTKGVFSESGYHVMLSDSCSLWEEALGARKIQDRAKVSFTPLQCLQLGNHAHGPHIHTHTQF